MNVCIVHSSPMCPPISPLLLFIQSQPIDKNWIEFIINPCHRSPRRMFLQAKTPERSARPEMLAKPRRIQPTNPAALPNRITRHPLLLHHCHRPQEVRNNACMYIYACMRVHASACECICVRMCASAFCLYALMLFGDRCVHWLVKRTLAHLFSRHSHTCKCELSNFHEKYRAHA